MRRFYSFFLKKDTIFLTIISCFFILFRLPSLFEPYWYGDEGIYEVIGFALNHGRALYTGIWDNKPPLLYYIYALVDGNQQGAKFLSLLAGLAGVYLFYFLAKRIFEKNKHVTKISFVTTSFFTLLFATPILEGTVANAENFMIFPVLIAAFLVWNYVEKKSAVKNLAFAGILLGIAFLIKVVAVFDFAAFFLFIFISQYKNIKNIVKQISPLIVFGISFALPILGMLGFYFVQGILKIALQSMFFSNIGYVGYGNTLIIPQGFLILKLLLLLIACVIIFILRKKTTTSHVFIFLWFLFGLFSAYFSQRPYTHYVLVLLSSSMLLVGLCLFEKKLKIIYAIITLCIFIFIGNSFALNFPRSFYTYYANFISYAFGQKTTNDYYSFFDRVTPRDYAIANFINLHKKPNDSVFIWGNSGQIYKLVNTLPPGRFIVAYHITSTQSTMQETKSLLEKVRPRFVVILPNQSDIPFSLENYMPFYMIDNAQIYAKIL